MSEKNIKTKEQLKTLIQAADYFTENEKNEWLKIVDVLNQEQVNEVFNEMSLWDKAEIKYLIKVLVKNGKGKKLLTVAKEITDKFKKQALAKQEAYMSGKEEKAEDILQKLNQI